MVRNPYRNYRNERETKACMSYTLPPGSSEVSLNNAHERLCVFTYYIYKFKKMLLFVSKAYSGPLYFCVLPFFVGTRGNMVAPTAPLSLFNERRFFFLARHNVHNSQPLCGPSGLV